MFSEIRVKQMKGNSTEGRKHDSTYPNQEDRARFNGKACEKKILLRKFDDAESLHGNRHDMKNRSQDGKQKHRVEDAVQNDIVTAGVGKISDL